MDRETIIRMVHESASQIEDYEQSDELPEDAIEFFMRFAELVVETERDKMANLVEQMGIEGYGTLAIAAAIRARGEQ
jgi:hypothetical protein